MTRTAGAPIGCQRPSRFWGLGCPKIYHEAEDTLAPCVTDQHTAHLGCAKQIKCYSNYSPLRLSTSLPPWIYNRFFMSVEA
ncbi:hypothetical protein [Thiolapillus sp.]|uniref:hypothetical protein n=1 Tax=Thiolapillus sp. TaxID=2017437 RepID=UPI0025D75DC0|nr:hypothetical protein [Thiolapillus sp.]